MRHRSRLLEVLERAETGPIMEETDFERKLVAPFIRLLAQKYGIKYDRQQIVPSDNDLADRLFQAGLEFATEVGLYCQNTSRRIVWSQQELIEGLRYCPSEAILGTGNDAIVVKTRQPEDNNRITIVGGAYGVPVPEDLFVPVMYSYACEPVVDVLENATLESVYGHPIKADSPWELLGGWREAELSFQVISRANRPGMCIGCVETSPTALGEISASSWGGFRPTDWHHVATISEFKTNYDALEKVVHTARIGGVLEAYYNPIYGGYVGGAEGVAIALTAAPILLNQIDLAHTFGTRPDHPFLNCDTTPEILWALSIAIQALSRNTNLLISSLAGPAGGPGTKIMLYELAAYSIATTVSGQSILEGSMSAGGRIPKHISGLEARLCGEIAHACSGMTREQGNEIVIKLLSKYEHELATKPIGQPFEEVYDLENIEPIPSWQGMYDDVKNELIKMGVPLGRNIW
jgi:methylamine--corrinoid protein Co-methyltransferase